MITLLSVLYAIASILLIVVVLIQAGKGAGMGLFGGGGSNTTFGARGGNILTRITTILGIIFFGIAIIFAIYEPNKKSRIEKHKKFMKEQKQKHKIYYVEKKYKTKKSSDTTGETSGVKAPATNVKPAVR